MDIASHTPSYYYCSICVTGFSKCVKWYYYFICFTPCFITLARVSYHRESLATTSNTRPHITVYASSHHRGGSTSSSLLHSSLRRIACLLSISDDTIIVESESPPCSAESTSHRHDLSQRVATEGGEEGGQLPEVCSALHVQNYENASLPGQPTFKHKLYSNTLLQMNKLSPL